MKLGAKLYIAAVCCAGVFGMAAAFIESSWQDPWRLVAYSLVTMIAAGLKVRLPGIHGTMSVSYIFVLTSIVHMGRAEAISMGIIAALVQSIWRAKKRPEGVQLVFNAAVAVITVSAAFQVYHHGFPPEQLVSRMAAAGCVYFVVNSIAIAGVAACTEGRSLFQIWRTAYFWSFPYYLVGASLSAVITYLTRFFGWELTLLVLPLAYIIYRSYHLYLDKLEGEKSYAEQMASLHLRTIEALALAIEAKDQTTGEHLRRVQVYAREIGRDLKLGEKDMMALQAASILHDIGKLAVPDYIISKPGRLTPDEFEKMKIHPVVGAEILDTISFPYPVVPIVAAHHEKWDGSGYPYGLKGEEIPIGARILSCVDCLDALASDRQYRRALPLDQALDLVRSESGKSFDPKVVDILSRRCEELEEKAHSEPLDMPKKLSRDVKVERGEAPDAGFEAVKATQPVHLAPGALVSSIAAARSELQALYEVTQTVGHSLSLTETLSLIAARVRTLVPYDGVAIYLQEENELAPAWVNGESYSLFNSLRIPLGQGLSGWVAENHMPILNGNPSVESGYLNDPTKFSVLRSALAVPLEGTSGCLGVMTLYAAEKDAFSHDQLRILQAISAKMSFAIETALSSRRSSEHPATDALTELPNAAAMFARLESEIAEASKKGAPLSVLVLDLDGFKQVNDQLGHLTGNRVLQTIGDVLKEQCREKDSLGRMGGDEFVALLPGVEGSALVARISALHQAVNEAGASASGLECLGVSIGAATYPADGDYPDLLLAVADRRMYRAKRERKQPVTAVSQNLLNLANSLSEEPRQLELIPAAELQD